MNLVALQDVIAGVDLPWAASTPRQGHPGLAWSAQMWAENGP
jgi:hypothetical protein